MTKARQGGLAIVAFSDEDDAELAAVLLEESGYRVVTCPDGSGPVSRLGADAAHVDLVVTDGLPPSELDAIRTTWPSAEVITTPRAAENSRPERAWSPLDLLIAAEAVRAARSSLH